MQSKSFSQYALRLPAICLLLLVGFLAGCTAKWQAPMESRGDTYTPPKKYTRSSAKFHKVQPGDTLYAIAWKAGTDYRTLASWNGIRSPYVIKVGQVLRLTPPSYKKTAKQRKPVVKKTRQASKKPVTKKSTTAKKSKKYSRSSLSWAWPTSGKVVSTYSANDELRKGIKVTGKSGQAIRAAANGKVVYSGSGLIGYGRLIIIKHNNKYLSAYGHNQKLLVKEGDQVTKGVKIAEMGQAPDGRTLLHFEIRLNGKPVNPLRMLPKG